MDNQNQTRIIRKSEVIQLLGISKSTLHYRIKDGLMPQPFPLGANSVGWLNTEISQIQAAIVSGASTSELKVVVRDIVSKRKQIA